MKKAAVTELKGSLAAVLNTTSVTASRPLISGGEPQPTHPHSQALAELLKNRDWLSKLLDYLLQPGVLPRPSAYVREWPDPNDPFFALNVKALLSYSRFSEVRTLYVHVHSITHSHTVRDAQSGMHTHAVKLTRLLLLCQNICR